MKRFTGSMRSSVLLVTMMTLLLGGVYPLVVTAISQTLFNYRANGSMQERGGKVMGSALIGQPFSSPKYFWGRLSATTPAYNPSASSGSNLNPGNIKLKEAVKARVDALHDADHEAKGLIPQDLATASASGLDPHISAEAALYQLHRVAKARGLKEEAVKALITKFTESPLLGMAGASYVNVLRLNMALDEK